MITSKLGQQVVGLVLLIMGGGVTVWSWNAALTRGSYSREAVALSPGCAVLGLGLLIFPIDIEKFRAEHGVDRPRQFSDLPAAWKILVFLAIAAGLANWGAISRFTIRQPQTHSVPAAIDDSSRYAKEETDRHDGRPASSEGLEALLSSIGLVLMFVGATLGLLGMVWGKTAELIRLFGRETNPDRGLWLALSGLVLLGIGLALLYYFHR